MWTLISVSLALGIHFYTPDIPKNKKSMLINENYYGQIGFPYQYFSVECLSEEEVHYRLRLIYIYLMFGLSTSLFLAPSTAVILPLLSSRQSIERIQVNEPSSQFKNFLKIAPTFIENSDKIVLTDKQIKQFEILIKQLISGSITMEEAILQIRGGDGLTDVVGIIAFVIFVNWYNSLFGVEAFQANPLPHMDPFGWSSGKYDSKNVGQCKSDPPSRFERETVDMMKRMCISSPDENGFVMDYNTAYNLIKETYQGSLQITNEQSIDYWQTCKKIYHAIDFGINPEDFGMTQSQLNEIGKDGFIAYAQRGNKLPSMEHVRAYQRSLKDICTDPDTVRRDDSKYYYKHGVEPSTVFKNDRYLVCFNQTSGDLITGDKQRRGTVNQFKKTNKIGSKKWIDKWSK